MKRRILCLHGKSQSGAIMSNKIAGARRKLSRVYELDFLDAPIIEEQPEQQPEQQQPPPPEQRAWWIRDDQGRDILLENAFDYVLRETKGKQYDALLGFSQGGLLATALVLSGRMPTIQAVVTAGAPYVEDVFQFAHDLANNDREQTSNGTVFASNGKTIPKLHFAGETDIIIPVERVQRLCDEGGNGQLILHDKGHMFPTKAVSVNAMMQFLEESISVE